MECGKLNFVCCSSSLVIVGLLTQGLALAADSDKKITADAERFAADKPLALQPVFKTMYIEGEHNSVLNLDYLGLAALEAGEYAIAEKAFDAAIGRIETVFANNPSAERAKSVFVAERVKDFKGEPYERAMTYYYRGLLYARAGDYENARASFLSAEWQSTMGESESYSNTFGLVDYLASWSSYCAGDDARGAELEQRVASIENGSIGTLAPTLNHLILIDVGVGPSKVGLGQYQEKLAFKPTYALPPSVDVSSAEVVLAGAPLLGADVNWQATTRGGRPVDVILNGKAQWKNGTETASSALSQVGYAAILQGAASGNSNLANAGTIGMAVGLVGGLFAKAMTPTADTRAWTTLPAGIFLAAGNAPAQTAPRVSFSVPDVASGTASLNVHAGKCGLSWGRTHSSIDAAIRQMQKPLLVEKSRDKVNAQFRTMLSSTFLDAEHQTTVATN